MKSLLKITVISLVLSTFLFSCAGARGTVRFDRLKYPVSMSGLLYDSKGKLAVVNKNLKVVGKLRYTKTIYSMVYTGATFNPQQEFGDAMNEQIAAQKGDGVVNLKLGSRNCVYNFVPIVTMLPFWPGCTVIKAKGDIVKYEN
jgi:hypothetical protein